MTFKLHDHLPSILFILLAIGIIIAILGFAKIEIERYSNLVPAAQDFVQTHGLWGGFLTAFIGSQWFIPFPYEIVVVPIMKLYQPTIIALLVISLGATCADITNFYTGRRFGEPFIEKRVEKKTLMRVQNFFTKYGVAILVIFAFIGPVTSYDVISFFMGGFSKLDLKTFIPLTFAARIIHFIVALLLANFLLGIAGFTI